MKSNHKKNAQKSKRSFRQLHASGEVNMFEQYTKCPDVLGPFRIPRAGIQAKTCLCQDRKILNLAYDGSNPVVGFIAETVYDTGTAKSGGISLKAATVSTLLTGTNNTGVGSQFPPTAQLDDVCLNAVCIVISYLGSVVNCKGEVIFGSVADDNSPLTAASYNSLYYSPGVMKVPLAAIIEKPLRIYGLPASYDAAAFYPTTTLVPDWNLPFVLTNGMATDGVLSVEVTRCWEGRSTTAAVAALPIPYESVGPDFSSDLAAFQNAHADLGEQMAQVDSGMNDYLENILTEIIPQFAGNALGLGNMGSSLLSFGAKQVFNLARSGQWSPLDLFVHQ